MAGNIEAIADAVTAAVASRAVEPGGGEADGHTHEANCLNCGTELIGPHCHECGQHAHVHRSLHAFFHDLAHGVFHFEGKSWRTLPLLIWKPGELTRRYIDGQRASFVSPIALFLFCVFLMFAVMGWTNSLGETAGGNSQRAEQALSQTKRELAQLEQERAVVIKSGGSTADIDENISGLKATAAALQIGKDHDLKVTTKLDRSKTMPEWMRRMIDKAQDNPELLFFKVKTNAYKFSWALIPISVPFVWLLFPFSRRFRLYDHTVFVTYSLSFMMLLLSAGTLVALVSGDAASLLWFVPPVHMYRQLRGTYGLSGWGAIWRTGTLTIFAFVAIALFAALLLALGVLD